MARPARLTPWRTVFAERDRKRLEKCGRCGHLRPKHEMRLSEDPDDPWYLCVDRDACAEREDA